MAANRAMATARLRIWEKMFIVSDAKLSKKRNRATEKMRNRNIFHISLHKDALTVGRVCLSAAAAGGFCSSKGGRCGCAI